MILTEKYAITLLHLLVSQLTETFLALRFQTERDTENTWMITKYKASLERPVLILSAHLNNKNISCFYGNTDRI